MKCASSSSALFSRATRRRQMFQPLRRAQSAAFLSSSSLNAATFSRHSLATPTHASVSSLLSRPYSLCALDGEDDGAEATYFLPSSRRTKKARTRYELGAVIGSGKFAEVREAVDTKTSENVAVKIMNKATCSPSLLENELKMMESVEDVSHQRMTPFKGAYEDDENVYFVMELLKGGEL